jgi:hypothetical protein
MCAPLARVQLAHAHRTPQFTCPQTPPVYSHKAARLLLFQPECLPSGVVWPQVDCVPVSELRNIMLSGFMLLPALTTCHLALSHLSEKGFLDS